MFDEKFYLGPLGGLRALPNATFTTDVGVETIGGTHVSLTGAYTRDVFGHKRSWTWEYGGLPPAQQNWVEALQYGLVPGPLYLIDPRRANRLPVQTATGGSLYRTTDRAFIPSNTAVCNWLPHTAITGVDTTTLPAAAVVRGACEWQLLSPGAAALELAGFALDGRLDIPLMVGAESLAVTAWLASTSAANVAVTATAANLAKVAVASTVSTPVTLSPTAWKPLTIGIDCPPSAASMRVRFDAAADSAAGSIYVTALSVSRSDDPEFVGATLVAGAEYDMTDYSAGFRVGGGAPQVVVGAGAASYVAPGMTANTLTVTERI